MALGKNLTMSVFYDSTGAPRSLSQIYNRFAAKLDAAGAPQTLDATSGLSATRLGEWGADVIPGNGEESTSNAAVWAQNTLAQLSGTSSLSGTRTETASLLRPTPNTARLAYMMLATMGA